MTDTTIERIATSLERIAHALEAIATKTDPEFMTVAQRRRKNFLAANSNMTSPNRQTGAIANIFGHAQQAEFEEPDETAGPDDRTGGL